VRRSDALDVAHKSGELVGSPFDAEYREVGAREEAADLVRIEELSVGAGEIVFFGEADDGGADDSDHTHAQSVLVFPPYRRRVR
jgi:hypothetical protein